MLYKMIDLFKAHQLGQSLQLADKKRLFGGIRGLEGPAAIGHALMDRELLEQTF